MEDRQLNTLSMEARRLRVPVAWLRDEADAGRIPAIKAGRQYLFASATVDQVLFQRASNPPLEVAHAG
jgi:excisionase family DNA binding protein